MKKILPYIVAVAASLIMAGIVLATNTFPTTLNDWEYGDIIEEDWADAVENAIGVINSSVVTSLDYLVKHNHTSNWEKSTINALTPTSTIGIIVNSSSTFTGTLTSSGGFIGNLTGTSTGASTLENTDFGTLTDTLACIYDLANTEIDCNTNLWDTLIEIPIPSTNFLIGNTSNQASTTSAIIVNSNNYIGIATSSPISNLSINGNVYASGDFNTPNGEITDFKEGSLTISSTTWQGSIGTSSDFWWPSQSIMITELACIEKDPNATNFGTTTIYLTDGTDNSDIISCGYVLVKDSNLTNNTWNSDEKMRWRINYVAGSPNGLVLRIKYYYLSD